VHRTIAFHLLVLAAPLGAGEADQDPRARGQDDPQRRITDLEKQAAADRRRIGELEKRLDAERRAALAEEVEAFLQEAPPLQGGVAPARLIDVSADLLIGGGGSTASNDDLLLLQAGGHDPRRRGFTLQQLELSLIGNVDPYFRGEAHLILVLDPEGNETEIELEEAFLQTLSLPLDLQLEVGQFFTEFGRTNPRHPHQWHFVDQPIVLNRFFGPDGMRAPGFRLGWLAPTPFFLQVHLGMQNAEGETMTSFLGNEEVAEERGVGGRPFVDRDVHSLEEFVYLLRVEASWDLRESWTALVGASAVFGPNSTGSEGRTVVYGVDVYVKWRPPAHDQGWPFFTFQTEVLGRSYRADAFDDGVDMFPRTTFDDGGFYAQFLYGWRRPWTGGLRVEWATGEDADGDPFRDDRLRLACLLAYHPSEYSRIRLQVNFDDADFLSSDEVSFWLVFEIGLGAHPAHTY
jgi:hypothetical protein